MQDSSVQVKQETHMIGPSLPSGFMKQEHMETETSGNVAEETSAAVAAIGSEIPQQGTESLSTSTGVITANYVAGTEGEGLGTIGPLVSEMSHGDEVVQAAEEFERRSRKMKDHLTIKVRLNLWIRVRISRWVYCSMFQTSFCISCSVFLLPVFLVRKS